MAFPLVTAALLAMSSSALAQDPYSSGSNPYSGSSGSSGSDPYSSGSGSGSYTELDYDKMTKYRIAHAVLASSAFVLFFPVGAITIRVLPSKYTLWIHAACQILAYVLFTVAVGLGVWLTKQIEFGTFKLINEAHPIIGLTVFALLFFQPILGLVHHYMFRKHARRVVWSYAHIWLGRAVITVGIINGGLGLRLANNTRKGEVAYAVIAAIIWLTWMVAAVYGEIKRKRTPKQELPPWDKERASSDESVPGMAQGRKTQSYRYV